MTEKIDVINDAYKQIRISGLTVVPTPEDLELALNRLENMMSEFEGSNNICLEYNFELEPDPNSRTNVTRNFWHMMSTNLAVRLVADFGKQVPPTIMAQASQSLSSAVSVSASESLQQVQYPRRMPRGSGNTLRFNRWRRFQRPQEKAPNSCATNNIVIGDIDDYTESFRAYLNDAETIDSFTITADNALSILSSANNDPVINYSIKAVEDSAQGAYQQVKIVITTSDARVETRFIDFNITSNKTVGAN